MSHPALGIHTHPPPHREHPNPLCDMTGNVARLAVCAVLGLVGLALLMRPPAFVANAGVLSTPAAVPQPPQEPEDTSKQSERLEYVKSHRLDELYGTLWEDLVRHKPQDPLRHILSRVRNLSQPKLVIIGAPASGKGTQCEYIIQSLGVVHVSTGDLLRDEMRKGSPLGKQAQDFVKAGKLVPDSVVVGLVRERLSKDDAKERGWLLDGFPRTIEQARIMRDESIVPEAVIVLDVADEVVIDRMAGRRVDPETKKVYHLKYKPPPQDVLKSGRLVQRPDDTKESIAERLKNYHSTLDPLLEVLGRASPVRRFEGSKETPAVIFDRILNAILGRERERERTKRSKHTHTKKKQQ
eukprot:TRINITY_DN8737_c0_g1_i3.p1 TRINITY_DN8737_c0_g1~~TRINITY_DN8737_c0_g1_i3.p1  ORF type:complete len:353 (+),score=44.10 TRINITY_DN8737_c0_g1_i3:136-1194(+)